jgi:WD40 repeat protein
VSGHRSQVTGVAYCRQSGLIASISHDQCLIHVESTLAKEKTLKCSTSSFTACGFSLSGNHLATTFKDGSVFLWNLGDYSHRDAALAQRQLKTTLNHNSILVVYNTKSILLADTSR